MRNAIGVILILLGFCLGIYAGLWWAFIGGIVQVIEAVRAPELDAMQIALGIARTLFASVIGGFAAIVCMMPGAALLGIRYP